MHDAEIAKAPVVVVRGTFMWQPSLPSWDGAGSETIGPAQTSLCYKPGMLTWLNCLTIVTSDLLCTISFFEITTGWSADVAHADNKPCNSLL